jgi:glucokinase
MLATPMTDSSPSPVVGIDLGGTSVKAALVSSDHRLMGRRQVPTDLRSQRVLLDLLTDLVASVRQDKEISAVGFGLPSQIDQRHGRVLDSVNIPLADLDFVAEMQRRLGVPVVVDNDANVACLAETLIGAARGARHVVMLTLGTGVGGGLVLDGRVYRGALGTGAELGHVTIDADGPPCHGNCRNRGCLEVMASATAIMRHANTLADERPGGPLDAARDRGVELDARYVIDQAEAGNSDAVEVLRRTGRYLGIGLAGFVNVFNPEVVVIGGGASAAGELLLGPAREEMEHRALPPTLEGVRLVAAELGNDAGIIGAAGLALELAGAGERA